jgi:hypothetical protein
VWRRFRRGRSRRTIGELFGVLAQAPLDLAGALQLARFDERLDLLLLDVKLRREERELKALLGP